MTRRKIKTIFDSYKISKIRSIHAEDIIRNSNNKDATNNQIISAKNYVKLVENILNMMDEEHADFLRKYYIENKKKEEFHYSISTFYFKLNKAIESFLKYLD